MSTPDSAPPLCPGCHALLATQTATGSLLSRAQCPKCREVFGRHSTAWLPSDEDTTALFDRAIERLKPEGYSFDQASDVLHEYFARFTNVQYCAENRVPLQDADSFHHDGPAGLALRAHYSVRLGLPPDYGSFVEWRAELQRRAGSSGKE